MIFNLRRFVQRRSEALTNVGELWGKRVQRPLSRYGKILNGGLLLGTVIFFGATGYSPQGRELFRIILERPDLINFQSGFAFIFMCILSGLLFYTYELFLPDVGPESESDDFVLKILARIALYGVAALPWIACFSSIVWMNGELDEAYKKLQTSTTVNKESVPGSLDDLQRSAEVVLRHIRDIQNAVLPTLIGVVVSCILLLILFGLSRRPNRLGSKLHGVVSTLVYAMAGILLFIFTIVLAFANATIPELFVAMGPLATAILATVELITLALVIAWFARATGLATLFGAVVLLASIWAFNAVLAAFGSSQKDYTSSIEEYRQPSSFENAVRSWVKGHSFDPKDPDFACNSIKSGVPLLIVSAQGGGMYAAIQSSLFLSRMHDRAPCFKRTIFAISSVSGGSIGTGFYHALTSPSGCDIDDYQGSTASEAGPVEKKTLSLLRKPHLAAILGNIPPDILRKIISPFFETVDRSDAFTSSILKTCPSTLGAAYRDHVYNARTPSLVLLTTWMKNGYRVPFAPFRLQDVGDGTLLSHDDIYQNRKPFLRRKYFTPSLIDAIVASARFPGILPPLSLTDGKGRQNFGDGGYADASGVTAAIEMLRSLNTFFTDDFKNSEDNADKVDLDTRLIVLTSDYKPTNDDDYDDTFLTETLAPVDALLGVRANLARKAITSAETLKSRSAPDRVFRISVDFGDFGIALGFQLSNTSLEILSLLIGRPEWCLRENPHYEGDNVILRNSCTERRILEFVSGRSKPVPKRS